jgi:hypothetical protein
MLGDLLGVKAAVELEEYKKPAKASPFEYINAISTNDHQFWTDARERDYNPFMVNRGLSFGADTVIYANEMNSRPHLDKRLQFDFLINTIRPRKRYNKWLKAETDEVLDVIQEYHGYSIHKARQVLNLFNDSQINLMRIRLNKGGTA